MNEINSSFFQQSKVISSLDFIIAFTVSLLDSTVKGEEYVPKGFYQTKYIFLISSDLIWLRCGVHSVVSAAVWI